jgi:endonuclease/exonuclease/phosphatase (EEP) superfamily protein YafD
MRLWKIIAIATAAELAFASAILAVIGFVGGALNGWLDLVNQFTPIGLLIGIVSLGLSWLVAPEGKARRVMITCSLVSIVAAVGLLAPDMAAAVEGLAAKPVRGAPQMRIAQFNVWNENDDLPLLVRTIRQSGADIVATEEIRCDKPSALQPLAATYPYQAGCGRNWPCGTMIYSKQKPIEMEDLTRGPATGASTCIMRAVFPGPDGKPFTLFVTHLGWPLPPWHQKIQRAALAELVKASAQQGSTVLVGDFNLTPWSYTLRNQDQALRPMARRTRALFTYPALIPRARFKSLPFLPIDQIYATPDWKVTDVKRLARSGSDHFPIIATFSR